MSADARAFVCGCAGLDFSADERRFIAEARPWGLILFRRNIGDPAQVARLTSLFRDIAGRADAPVLVDQEGGRTGMIDGRSPSTCAHAVNPLAGGFTNRLSRMRRPRRAATCSS